MPDTQKNPVFYRRSDAAELVRSKWGIPCATRTLAKLASVGGGPEMVYSGRIPLYTEKALDAWAGSRISAPVTSTSERDNRSRRKPLAVREAPSVVRRLRSASDNHEEA